MIYKDHSGKEGEKNLCYCFSRLSLRLVVPKSKELFLHGLLQQHRVSLPIHAFLFFHSSGQMSRPLAFATFPAHHTHLLDPTQIRACTRLITV